MVETGRGIVVLLFALLLSGCFLVPGEFVSNLDIRKDGTFSFAYRGQIVFALPDDVGGSGNVRKVWADSMAECYESGRTRYDPWDAGTEIPMPPKPETAADRGDDATTADPDSTIRACKPAEIVKLRKEFEAEEAAKAARKKKEAAEMAAVFGLGPNDDAANAKIAAEMTKYAGWKSVTYKGKGIYDVDYQITGRVGHDFIFPVFPQGDILIPFVTMRPRGDGTAFVSAPALAGGGFKGLSSRMKMLGAAGAGRSDFPQTSVVTKGRFTITTDGVPLTNNTSDGPVAGTAGQTLTWDVDNNSEKIPEALIRLR